MWTFYWNRWMMNDNILWHFERGLFSNRFTFNDKKPPPVNSVIGFVCAFDSLILFIAKKFGMINLSLACYFIVSETDRQLSMINACFCFSLLSGTRLKRIFWIKFSSAFIPILSLWSVYTNTLCFQFVFFSQIT